jgi:probable addiction module antidote protein
MAKAKFAPYSSADYLDNEKGIAEYLAAAMEDPNPDVFLLAVSNVAKARGIAKVAKDSGLGRESLYKTLTPGAKPRYETLRKIVEALGVKWTIAKPSVMRRPPEAHA